MTITKKEIYARYGIEYRTANNGQIYHPVMGWIKPLLKEGNTKVGKKTFTFSLTPGKDGTCVCDCDNCYAKTGHYCKPNVKRSMELNVKLVETDIDFVKRAISAQIIADKIQLVRIHAAGDFAVKNHAEYIAMWKSIVLAFPNIRFWTYTKVQEDETLFDGIENANIVKSLLPMNLGLNYGTCKEILEKYHILKKAGYNPHICACGTSLERHCDECHGCNENEIVLFILHSCSSYDCKNDLLLPAIIDIIKQQKEG